MTGENANEPLNPYALSTWATPSTEPDRSGIPAEPDEGTNHDEGFVAQRDPLVQRDPRARVHDFSRPEEYSRRALNLARSIAQKNGYVPRTRWTTRVDPRDRSVDAPGYSGARPDARDPQPVSVVLDRVLSELGWDDGLSAGRVLAEWDDIVGPRIAEHSEVISCEDGVLVISADSSAWAAQLRLLSAQLITAIHERVGRPVVTELHVKGPHAHSWKKGKRSVTWRGVRDTYG